MDMQKTNPDQALEDKTGKPAKPSSVKLDHFFDGVSSRGKARGWARDPAQPELHMVVEIRADDQVLGRTIARVKREKLAALGYGHGVYGYEFALPAELASRKNCTIFVGVATEAGTKILKSHPLVPPALWTKRNIQIRLAGIQDNIVTGDVVDTLAPDDRLVVELRAGAKMLGSTLPEERSPQAPPTLGYPFSFKLDAAVLAEGPVILSAVVSGYGQSGPKAELTVRPPAQVRPARPQPALAKAGMEKADAAPAAGKSAGAADKPQPKETEKPGNPAPPQPAATSGRALQFFADVPASGYINGWIRDRARPEERLRVQLRIDGEVVGEVLADNFRAALVPAGIGDGRYGFSFFIPGRFLDGKDHQIGAFEVTTGAEARNSPRKFNFAGLQPRPAVEARQGARGTDAVWSPPSELIQAVVDHFAGQAPLSAAHRRGIEAILPFADVIADLDLAAQTPFPPNSAWRLAEGAAPMHLRVVAWGPDRSALAATLCSWALISASPPEIAIMDQSLAEAVRGVVHEFGGVLERGAVAHADSFTVHVVAGDIIHPGLPGLLSALPAGIDAVSWDMALVEAPICGAGPVQRLRPPIPYAGLVGIEAPLPYALAPGVTSLPSIRSNRALVLPKMLSARYATGTKSRMPALPTTPHTGRMAVIVGGDIGSAFEDTLKNIAAQKTRQTPLLLASVPTDAPDKVLAGHADWRIIRHPASHSRRAWWSTAAAAGEADILVFVEAGLIFADPQALQRLADWAELDGVGLVAGCVSERIGRDQLRTHPPYRVGGRSTAVPDAAMQHGSFYPHRVPYEELRCWAARRSGLSNADAVRELPGLGDIELARRLAQNGLAVLNAGSTVSILGPRSTVDDGDPAITVARYPELLGIDVLRPSGSAAGMLEWHKGRVRLRLPVSKGTDGAAAMLEWHGQARLRRLEQHKALRDATELLQSAQEAMRLAELLNDDLLPAGDFGRNGA